MWLWAIRSSITPIRVFLYQVYVCQDEEYRVECSYGKSSQRQRTERYLQHLRSEEHSSTYPNQKQPKETQNKSSNEPKKAKSHLAYSGWWDWRRKPCNSRYKPGSFNDALKNSKEYSPFKANWPFNTTELTS